jgi:two-component system, cell cycle sensor histidine kinase and response regulator CckA
MSQSDGPSGTESILLVEDNADLRELVCGFLAAAGYQVHSVGGPGEAETLWEKERGAIDLLITDIVMPKKSGKVLAAGLQARKPALKILYISGYALPAARGEPGRHYLQKPFTRNELLTAVRAACEGRPGGIPGITGD